MSVQATDRTNGKPEPKRGDKPARRKFGLVLQGAAALGAYEVGAVEYLYDSGMECAIVSGASSGAMNAATLAGARGYPPQVLRELWGMLAVKPPVPFLPLFPVTQDEHEDDAQNEHVEADIPGAGSAVRAHGDAVVLTVTR